MDYRSKLVDSINRLYAAGYRFDYPSLAEKLAELEEIDARDAFWARMNEVI